MEEVSHTGAIGAVRGGFCVLCAFGAVGCTGCAAGVLLDQDDVHGDVDCAV